MYQSHSSFVCSKLKKKKEKVSISHVAMIMGTAKLYEDEKAWFWSLTNRIKRLPSKSSQATDIHYGFYL